MQSDEFRQRYELGRQLTESGILSSEAADSEGTPVMVHFLGGHGDEAQLVLALLEQLDPADKARIVETVEVDGVQVVVTQVLEDFSTLEEWLEKRAAPPEPSATGPAAPGEFTRLFGSPLKGQAEEEPVTAEKPQKKSFVTSTFAKLFAWERGSSAEPETPRRRRLSIRLHKPESAAAGSEAKPAVSRAKGPSDAALDKKAREPAGPGEFTEIFGTASGAKEATPATPAATGAPPGSAKLLDHATSDYLKALDASAQAADSPGAIDRAEPQVVDSAEAEAPPAAAPAPVTEGPSEYTQVVSGRQPAPAAPLSSPAAFFQQRKERMVRVSSARRPRLRFLILWLVIIVAAGVAVVYFLTRP
ncbi:MAG: hypothetical protein JSV86_13585 [Gemmatimonadota bacterium]|nr:MAG: hypothetical protein JSV86_13585 [Gemmatimonadota bacterium]